MTNVQVPESTPRAGAGIGSEVVYVALPGLCQFPEVELAHELMQRHRACRIGRCLWKAAAHRTLTLAGRLTPQSMSPRERAAARGMAYPVRAVEVPPFEDGPGVETLRGVLDRLAALATFPGPVIRP